MKKPSATRVLTLLVLGLLGVCLLLTAASLLSNINRPTASATLDTLSEAQKAYLQEATHLRQTLGGQIWPGWDQADIPFIVYNEAYAFLVGYPDPPDGWLKMPSREPRGGAWQPVPADTFQGETYYRQPLPDPDITPEAFTVLVGERWVASLPTREFMAVGFYQDFPQELPAFLRPIFPYRLMWRMLMGSADAYIEGLNHEAFHAYLGMVNAERLSYAEQINTFEAQYPFGDPGFNNAWKAEMELALSALNADSTNQALEITRKFLQARQDRRQAYGFSPDLETYEREREWLEGLAKYAELDLGRLANATRSYAPLPAILDQHDFDSYSGQERLWKRQLGQALNAAISSGSSRFYYSGLVQAALLDRLSSDWKTRTFTTHLALEDLLRELTPIQP